MVMKCYSIILIFILFPLIGIAQGFGDSDLIELFAHQWNETSMGRERILIFNIDGTYSMKSKYDKKFLVTGRYWLYQTPLTANDAFNNLVETDQIKGTIRKQNPFKKWIGKHKEGLSHPDMETHHGFILEQVYANGVTIWQAGVWRIVNEHYLELTQGCSKNHDMGHFYFKGKKIDSEW